MPFLCSLFFFCCDSKLKPSAQLDAAKLNKRVASATSSFNSFSTVNVICFMMVEHLIHPGQSKHLLFSLTGQDEMTRDWLQQQQQQSLLKKSQKSTQKLYAEGSGIQHYTWPQQVMETSLGNLQTCLKNKWGLEMRLRTFAAVSEDVGSVPINHMPLHKLFLVPRGSVLSSGLWNQECMMCTYMNAVKHYTHEFILNL